MGASCLIASGRKTLAARLWPAADKRRAVVCYRRPFRIPSIVSRLQQLDLSPHNCTNTPALPSPRAPTTLRVTISTDRQGACAASRCSHRRGRGKKGHLQCSTRTLRLRSKEDCSSSTTRTRPRRRARPASVFVLIIAVLAANDKIADVDARHAMTLAGVRADGRARDRSESTPRASACAAGRGASSRSPASRRHSATPRRGGAGRGCRCPGRFKSDGGPASGPWGPAATRHHKSGVAAGAGRRRRRGAAVYTDGRGSGRRGGGGGRARRRDDGYGVRRRAFTKRAGRACLRWRADLGDG